MLTYLCPTDTKRIHTDAAVVRIGLLISLVEPRRPLAVPGIAAAAAFHEPLQQVHLAHQVQAKMDVPALHLLSGRLEQIHADKGGHSNRDLILRVAAVPRLPRSRLLGSAAPGAQRRSPIAHAGLAERRLP